MIRRSVRKNFHTVWWQPPTVVPPGPIIFAATHHGWHDGYLMYHLVSALGRRSLDWITEFDAFPLFARCGGMPFPVDKPELRAATIRQTIRLMNDEGRSLILFPEQHLHEPPGILPLGKAIQLLKKKAPHAVILPVALVYRMSVHERPSAYIGVGSTSVGPLDLDDLRAEMSRLRDETEMQISERDRWQVLVEGTKDVNERWDFRARFGKK